ncbi:MAG: LPXTG cell wall anchor domain-containing protein [Nocardioides sp.]
MRTSHHALTTARSGRLATRLAVALALVLGMLGLGIGPASAHHPEITASADCDGKVTWTANSWSTGQQGTNPDIRVERSIAGGAWTEIAQGAFNAANAYKFSDSFDAGLPYPSSVQLRVKALADWANGAGGGQTFGPVAVTFPTDCVPPAEAKPTAGITADCTGFTATLTNLEGTAPALFTLVAPDGTTEDVTVPAGEQTTRTFPVTEDVAQTVKILVAGKTLAEKTYTADCIRGEDTVRPRPPVKLPTVIQGVSTVKPQAAVLPQTGASDHQGALLAGLLLVALGGSLLVARRGERA